MSNFKNNSVVFVPTNELVENQFTPKFYPTDKEYEDLKSIISLEGIMTPLIITTDKIVISGIRRLRVARALGIETVPCNVSLIEESEIEKHALLSNQYRNKTEYERYVEWRRLKVIYSITQGARTDLMPEMRIIKDVLVSDFSKSTLENYDAVNRLLKKVIGKEHKDKAINDLKSEVAVSKVKNQLSKLVQKQEFEKLALEHEKSLKGDNVKIYNMSCDGTPNAEDNSVDCIVCSPPYYNVKDYNNGVDELGHEKTAEEFVENLVQIFVNTKRCLKSSGKIWVNLMDTMENGHYHLVPEMFEITMKKNGFYVADKIVWAKRNPRPTSTQGSNISHETIVCFTLEPKPQFNSLNIEGGIDFNDNTVSLNEGNRTISHWLIGEKTIVTNVNNFSELKKKCKSRGIPFEHSAGFPSIIPQMLIQMSTKPGDVVMDIFMGTGTTGYEALRLGRDFIGYELNPDYFIISQVRLEEFLDNSDNKENEVVFFDFKNRLELPTSSHVHSFSQRILWPKQNYAS